MSELCVTIHGRQYRLAVSTGEEELLKQCAEIVDKRMNSIHERGKVMNMDQVAALTALDLVYDSIKAETKANKKIEELTAQVEELQALLKQHPQTDGVLTPVASTPGEAALLKEVEALADQCEKAIFSDMKKGSLL